MTNMTLHEYIIADVERKIAAGSEPFSVLWEVVKTHGEILNLINDRLKLLEKNWK